MSVDLEAIRARAARSPHDFTQRRGAHQDRRDLLAHIDGEEARTRAAIVKALERGALLAAHRYKAKGRADCSCGWSGGSMYPSTPYAEHIADVLTGVLP
jgi:hypothetical protein